VKIIYVAGYTAEARLVIQTADSLGKYNILSSKNIIFTICMLHNFPGISISLMLLGMIGPTSGYTFLGSATWFDTNLFYDTVNGVKVINKRVVEISSGMLGLQPNFGIGLPENKAMARRFASSPVVAAYYKKGTNATITRVNTYSYYDIPYVLAKGFRSLLDKGADVNSILNRDKLLSALKQVNFTGKC
jgi:hypothetical protein